MEVNQCFGTQKKCPFLLNRGSVEITNTKIMWTFFRDQILRSLNGAWGVPLIEVSQRCDSTAVWGGLFSRVALVRENIFPFSFRRGGWGGRKKWNWKECVCRNAFSAKIPLILNSSNDGLRCNEPRSSLRTGTYYESHLCKKDSMPGRSLHYKFRKLYYPTLVSVWRSAGEENKSSLGTGGERAANRLKNDAVKTVCKETSGSREVFRDPGVMTGTRDFKATREQDRRCRCRKSPSGLWDWTKILVGMTGLKIREPSIIELQTRKQFHIFIVVGEHREKKGAKNTT